jgi:hypothetical protein
VQQSPDLLAFALIKFWFGCLRARRLLLKTAHALTFKGTKHITDCLVRTSELARYLARRFPFSTQEKKLASPQCERQC